MCIRDSGYTDDPLDTITVTNDLTKELTVNVLGNVITQNNLSVGGTLSINNITAAAQHSLQAVTNVGNVTSNTVQFSNAITSLVASSNIVVTGNVSAGHDTNTTSYFGRAAVGYMGQDDQASFAHVDHNDPARYAIKQTAAGPTYINTPAAGHIRFTVNDGNSGAEKMRITSAGKVGVGVTSPDATLHVVGNAYVSSNLTVSGNTTVSSNLTVSGNVEVNNVLLVSKMWTKEIPFQTANGTSDYIYIGCFHIHNAVEVEIADNGTSLGASNKFTITRHWGHVPFVSGHRGSRYAVHKFYWAQGNDINTDYHLWHQPIISGSTSGQYRVRYKTATVLDQAENTTGRAECNYGLISQENSFGTYVAIPMGLSFDGSSWYTVTSHNTHLSTGTWIVNVYIHSAGGAGSGQLYDETYSGLFTWYSGVTNSNVVNDIPLHYAGHAPNGEVISMRTARQGVSAGTNLLFQIKSNMNWNGTVRNTTFHFRRLV